MSHNERSLARLKGEKDANFGQLLVRAARLWNERALAVLHEVPRWSAIRASHLALLPHLDWTGTRLTDLAAKVGVTKQAVQPLLDDLEEMGVIERIVDPADARARLVRLNAQAVGAIAEGLQVLRAVQREVEQVAGADALEAAIPLLRSIISALEPE